MEKARPGKSKLWGDLVERGIGNSTARIRLDSNEIN